MGEKVWMLWQGEMCHTGLRGATEPAGLVAVWSLQGDIGACPCFTRSWRKLIAAERRGSVSLDSIFDTLREVGVSRISHFIIRFILKIAILKWLLKLRPE